MDDDTFKDTMLTFASQLDEKTTAQSKDLVYLRSKMDKWDREGCSFGAVAHGINRERIAKNETTIAELRNGKRRAVAIGAGGGGIIGAFAAFIVELVRNYHSQ